MATEEEFEGLKISGTKLSWAGADRSEIPQRLAERYGESATQLDMSYNCITALSHLDGFVRLESLVLDNNSLEDGGFTLPPLLNLTTLCMNNNNLADIESVLNEVSTKAPNVRYLSLLKNPCCPTPIFDAEKDDDDYQRYRYYVLHRLPRLQFLDSNAVSPDELSEAQRVGRFMRVARPEVLKAPAKPREEEVVDYRPLPDDSRPEGAGPARFGVSKYVYYGRQSEGNRFITDENL